MSLKSAYCLRRYFIIFKLVLVDTLNKFVLEFKEKFYYTKPFLFLESNLNYLEYVALSLYAKLNISI